MKKKDLYSFMRGLKMTRFEHPRSTYVVNKNKRLLEPIIEDMEKSVEPNEQMKEFQKEREELAKKHCAKDDKGNPTLTEKPDPNNPGGSLMHYEIPDQNDEKSTYGKALKKIQDKFKKDTDTHDAKVKKYQEFLEEKSEYEPFKIDLSFLEKNEKCPQPVMDQIHWMVRDDVFENKK